MNTKAAAHWITLILILVLSAAVQVFGQSPSDASTVASCTFQDGKQISVHYAESQRKTHDLQSGKPWMPGDAPAILFTGTDVSLGNKTLPVGAYSLYVVPEKENWTLVVNKNVSQPKTYERSQDLARANMLVGTLGQKLEEAKFAFSRVGPNQCNLRLYYGNKGSWVEFHEK